MDENDAGERPVAGGADIIGLAHVAVVALELHQLGDHASVAHCISSRSIVDEGVEYRNPVRRVIR